MCIRNKVCILPISGSGLIFLLSPVSGRLNWIRVRSTGSRITPFGSCVTTLFSFVSRWWYCGSASFEVVNCIRIMITFNAYYLSDIILSSV